MPPLLVLTAANAAQARAYRAQLAGRRDLPEWLVVPDPRGARVGSGGSTLAVLFALARRFAAEGRPGLAALFEGRTVFIVHSGGDARRLPMFAAQGKVFTPLPSPPGERLCLLDLLLRDLRSICLPEGGRVVIAAGDLLLDLASQPVSVTGEGLVGVACRGSPATARRHGVYIARPDGRVADFLQKPDRTLARERGAIAPDGSLLIDTGLLVLDPPTVERWLLAAGARRRGRDLTAAGALRQILAGRLPTLDLYRHILMAACAALSPREFVDAFPDMPPGVLRPLRAALHPHGARVVTLPHAAFVHLGTSREYLDALTAPSPAQARIFGPSPGPVRVINSTGTPAPGRGPAVLEGCVLGRALRFGGENIVAGLPRRLRLDVPRGWCLAALPIGSRRWAMVTCGVDDDFKTPLESGATLGNRPMSRLVRDAAAAWPRGAEQTLWTARLWRIGTLRQVLHDARSLWRGVCAAGPGRSSLASLLLRVDHDRLAKHREEIRRRLALAGLARRAVEHRFRPAEELFAEAHTAADRSRALRKLRRAATAAPPLHAARLHALAAEFAASGRAAARHRQAALACVARAVEPGIAPAAPRPGAIRAGALVEAESPVRIDLAGGWSDTPPICHEVGGAVVNAAITLEGRRPIRVTARLIQEPIIRIVSIDLGRVSVVRTSGQAGAFGDPRRWDALPKAALALAGITPVRGRATLESALATLGGGLELTLDSALPKGSGLGVSSVLGATVLAALARLRGEAASTPALVEGVTVLEQRMHTGGGWQDQAGGITPGFKLLTTQAGMRQRPAIELLPMDIWHRAGLAERSLLYFTGLRRMARDILRGVVHGWLRADRRVVGAVGALKANAAAMAAAIRGGDGEGFARELAAYWRLKRTIDPGATNGRIEAIVDPIRTRLDAFELTGAGGGGFLFLVARSAADARRIRRELERRPPNREAGFHGFAIDTVGLSVRVR